MVSRIGWVLPGGRQQALTVRAVFEKLLAGFLDGSLGAGHDLDARTMGGLHVLTVIFELDLAAVGIKDRKPRRSGEARVHLSINSWATCCDYDFHERLSL